MIALVQDAARRRSLTAIHAAFLAMLPKIRQYAAAAFAHCGPEARQEAVQEVLANCWAAYVRLVARGKGDLAYPTVLARFGVAQYRDGRRVGNRRRAKDVLSEYAQQQRRFVVERLDCFDRQAEVWKEALVADHRTPPPDQAAFRCDFPAWLGRLPRRQRRIAASLALGNTTGEVAQQFHLSAGRVSQLRRELAENWQRFVGTGG